MKRRSFFSLLLIIVSGFIGFFTGRSPFSRSGQSNQILRDDLPSISSSSIYNWRMVTSWPRNSPGTGTSAQSLADKLALMSDGKIQIRVYGANELVGGLEVFDAVARGTAEIGHSASFFWQGKTPLSVFWTAVPFGLNPKQHHAWLAFGGGQDLWDEVYRPFGLKAFAAGNTGPSMGGWFTARLDFSDPLPFRGLKFRMPGLGREVIREFGATPVNIPPTEVFTALQSGAIDATELLAPWQDMSFGIQRLAKYCYYPGFHEPNGSSECLINLDIYQSLPRELQQMIQDACNAVSLEALAQSDWNNSMAINRLRDQGVSFIPYPQELLDRMKVVSDRVLRDLANTNQLGRRIYQSYTEALRLLEDWEDTKL